MFSEYFLFFNILLFSGFGIEIIFGHKRSDFKPYFTVCAVNSFTLIINSLAFFLLKDSFFVKYAIGEHYVFLMAAASAFFLNELFFMLLRHSDFNIFDSINLVSIVFPMQLYLSAKRAGDVLAASAGAGLAFLIFSSLFFYIKRHVEENCDSADDFTVFCYEMILFGLFSASFSIFFRVV